MEEGKDRSCTWVRRHDTTGQYHYETGCGKQVFASHPLAEDAPPYCYNCGASVEVSEPSVGGYERDAEPSGRVYGGGAEDA
ncbi:hypothetical protein [Adlercreutzia shanghongiae]|uniref:Zinc ribbon domain-containing protein n=1 Tax=Adlercreutzia shanghongiae TaxID=3111773 RepID=A0ABU6IWU7_9ACTN|nr:hypothetical protein [Adlercreutzia sp. R22]MEC4294024.1 hypothetical protein [Adlercreutzia sp. R22]